MGFVEAVRTCLSKYVTFSGRASRPEFWWFALFLFLASLVLGMVDSAVFGTAMVETGPGTVSVQSRGPLASLFSLAALLPSLAAGWRRMHDTGRSGLFLLYPLIVMLGIMSFVGFAVGFGALLRGDLQAILAGTTGIVVVLAALVLALSPLIVIWWLTRPTQPGANAYGPEPQTPRRGAAP